jgi:hypothetical protein
MSLSECSCSHVVSSNCCWKQIVISISMFASVHMGTEDACHGALVQSLVKCTATLSAEEVSTCTQPRLSGSSDGKSERHVKIRFRSPDRWMTMHCNFSMRQTSNKAEMVQSQPLMGRDIAGHTEDMFAPCFANGEKVHLSRLNEGSLMFRRSFDCPRRILECFCS